MVALGRWEVRLIVEIIHAVLLLSKIVHSESLSTRHVIDIDPDARNSQASDPLAHRLTISHLAACEPGVLHRTDSGFTRRFHIPR
jgi:hypothetical protein